MSTACRASGDETLQLLSSLKNMSKTASVPGNIQGVEMTLKDIERVAKVIWRYSVCAPVFVKCVWPNGKYITFQNLLSILNIMKQLIFPMYPYTLSLLENNCDVSSYPRERCLLSCGYCVFSQAFKKQTRDWHIKDAMRLVAYILWLDQWHHSCSRDDQMETKSSCGKFPVSLSFYLWDLLHICRDVFSSGWGWPVLRYDQICYWFPDYKPHTSCNSNLVLFC